MTADDEVRSYDSLRPGDPRSLGGYELVGRLGSGGQSVVYLGRAQAGELVAIKLMLAERGLDARRSLLKELDAARRVAAFCTARVLDAVVDGDGCYLVSEYIEGPTLAQVVAARGPRRADDLRRLAIGTATALAAIHQAGVVHRDFKPGNVLISAEGPRVIDFGISRALDAGTSTTSGVIGTPAYMAPEQLSSAAVGPAADVFAWGATMCFAASGRPAFGNDSIPKVMHRILHGEPDLSNVDGTLREIVAGALAKEPSQRPTAHQILLGLLGDEHPRPDLLKAGSSVASIVDPADLAVSRTWRDPLPAPARRTWLLLTGGGGLMVAVIVVLAALLVTRSGAAHVQTPAVRSSAAGPTAGTAGNAALRAVAGKRDAAYTVTYTDTSGNPPGSYTVTGGILVYRPGAGTDISGVVQCAGEISYDHVIVIGTRMWVGTSASGPWEPHSSTPLLLSQISGAVGCGGLVGPYLRLAVSLDNITALVRADPAAVYSSAGGLVTLSGTAHTDQLAALDPVGPLYSYFSSSAPQTAFTIRLNADNDLPLQVTLGFRDVADPAKTVTITVTYDRWGQAGSVAAP